MHFFFLIFIIDNKVFIYIHHINFHLSNYYDLIFMIEFHDLM